MKKLLSFLIISIFVVCFSICYAVDFYDLNQSHWSYEAVSKMTEAGILNGYPDGSFRPNNDVSLAEFSKILVEFYQVKSESNSTLSQPLESHWAYDYLKTISNYWTNPDSFLDVDSPVLREDVISTIIKVRGYDKANYTNTHDFIHFYEDRNEIRDDLLDYIEIALEDNIVKGDNYMLSPKGNLTRAQVCQIFYNISKIDDLGDKNNKESVNDSSNQVISNNSNVIKKFEGIYKNSANESLKYTGYLSSHYGKDENYFSVFTSNENDINKFIPDFWGKTNNRYLINFTESTQTAFDMDVPECQFVLVCDDTTDYNSMVIDMYSLSDDKTFLKSQVRGEQYDFYKVSDSYGAVDYINEVFDFDNSLNGLYKQGEKQVEMITLKNQNLGASDSILMLSNDYLHYLWKENLSDNSIPYVLKLYLENKDASKIKDIYTNRYYANYCSGIIIYQNGSFESFSIQMSKSDIGKVQIDSEVKLIKQGNIEKPSDYMRFLDKWGYQTLLRDNSFSNVLSK